MRSSHLVWALAVCSAALSACAPDVVRHNEAGNERFAGQTYDGAIDESRLARVAEPDRAEPYYNAANAYNRQSELDAAVAQTQQALKTADPELAERAWYNLGNAYSDGQQWPEAIQAYKAALRLQPDDGDAKHNLELALQKLQEQQQQRQEQQQGQQDRQEQGDSEQEQESQSEGQQEDTQGDRQDDQARETPAPEEHSTSAEGRGEESEQPSGEPQEAQGMTPEEAMQLLQALLGDSETLRERLRELYIVPGPAPEQDW